MSKVIDYTGWVFVCLFVMDFYAIFICVITGEFGVCHVHYNMFNEIYLEAAIIGLSVPFVIRHLWRTLKTIKKGKW